MAKVFSEKVEVRNQTGTTVSLDLNGDAKLGGNGVHGDLLLFASDKKGKARNQANQARIHLQGGTGNLRLGGNGADGDLWIYPAGAVPNGKQDWEKASIVLDGDSGKISMRGVQNDGVSNIRILLDPRYGNLTLGGDGQDGDLIVKDKDGTTAIRLDGDSGEITIKNWSISVPDYVFAPEYPLRSLGELSAYIQQNHHLPDVPSATEIQQEGMNFCAFTMTLLQKVEELTLYILQQQQAIESFQNRLEELKVGKNA